MKRLKENNVFKREDEVNLRYSIKNSFEIMEDDGAIIKGCNIQMFIRETDANIEDISEFVDVVNYKYSEIISGMNSVIEKEKSMICNCKEKNGFKREG